MRAEGRKIQIMKYVLEFEPVRQNNVTFGDRKDNRE
jgi:hypothetical protein